MVHSDHPCRIEPFWTTKQELIFETYDARSTKENVIRQHQLHRYEPFKQRMCNAEPFAPESL